MVYPQNIRRLSKKVSKAEVLKKQFGRFKVTHPRTVSSSIPSQFSQIIQSSKRPFVRPSVRPMDGGWLGTWLGGWLASLSEDRCQLDREKEERKSDLLKYCYFVKRNCRSSGIRKYLLFPNFDTSLRVGRFGTVRVLFCIR